MLENGSKHQEANGKLSNEPEGDQERSSVLQVFKKVSVCIYSTRCCPGAKRQLVKSNDVGIFTVQGDGLFYFASIVFDPFWIFYSTLISLNVPFIR